MKRLLLMFLLCVPFMGWAQQFVVANEGQPIYYRVLDKNNVAVCAPSSSYAIGYKGTVSIPSEVRYRRHRYQVTTVAAEAFAGCTEVVSVALPATIRVVEYHAFQGCSRLQSLTLPSATMRVEEGAFARCESLQQVMIANGDCEVHRDAFIGCDETLRMECPEHSTPDTMGLYWQEYYKASCYRQCAEYVLQVKEERDAEKARMAGDFRKEIRQMMEKEQQKWEVKHGQLPQDRPQLAPPAKRTTPLGNKGD